MRHATIAALTLLAAAHHAHAEERRLYITTAACAGSPNAPSCQNVGTICVTRDESKVTGVVERLSAAQRQHKIPPGLRFELSASDLKGRYIVAYPGNDKCKSNLHEYSAQGALGGGEGAGRYIEFSYPYRQLDLETCQLAGEPTDPKTRLFEVTDGSTCGAAPRKSVEVKCPSGPRRITVQIVGSDARKFQGLAITNEKDGTRTVLSPSTLQKAMKAHAGHVTPILTWRTGDGEPHTVHAETVLEAACGAKTEEGLGSASLKMLMRKAAEDWFVEYAETKCKGDKDCVKTLDVSPALGSRG
jgi:hypothetical protein